jgi:hypothetical protein
MECRRRPFSTAAGWFFAPALPLGMPKCAARPRPHAEEHCSAKRVGCFPSSASLRCVSKHEGHAVAVLILRDARTLLRLCASACACALLRMRTASRFSPAHDVKQPISQPFSFPRRIFAPGGFATWLHSPRTRGGRSAEKRSGAAAPVGRAHNAARQAPSDPPPLKLRRVSNPP